MRTPTCRGSTDVATRREYNLLMDINRFRDLAIPVTNADGAADFRGT